MNALTLPPALRFNAPAVPEALETWGKAMATSDPIGRAEELARLGEFGRLREFGVPEDELDEVAEAVAARPGAIANPRPASSAEIRGLLEEIY
jgi:alcohol dehydrogenase class IV